MLSSAAEAQQTNVSLLYGWNGTVWTPLKTDPTGILMSTLNFTESVGMNPQLDNSYDLGNTTFRWRNIYDMNTFTNSFLGINTTTVAGIVRVSTNGSNVFNINETGRVGINITNPTGIFQVSSSGANALVVANGNVGIGTTNPQQTLVVAGDLNVTGNFISSANVTNIDTIGNMIVGRNLTVGGTNLFVNNATGRVGIGTTEPAQKLDVVGLFLLGDNRADATAKEARLYGAHYTNTEEPMGVITGASGATTNVVNIGGGTSAVNAATQIKFWTAANSTTTTGTEQLRLSFTGGLSLGSGYVATDAGAGNMIISGNVGIATVAPVSELEVNGTAPTFTLRNGTLNGAINFDVNATGDLIVNSSSTNNLLVVQKGGWVGINTTSPASVLHIVGTQNTIDNYGGSVGLIFRRANGNPASPTQVTANQVISTIGVRPYFSDTGAFSASSLATINMAASEDITSTTGGTYIVFQTTPNGSVTQAERVRINNAGFVGINTTTPSGLLQVNVNGSDVFHINETGRVGINTTSPDAALHVIGNVQVGYDSGTLNSYEGAGKYLVVGDSTNASIIIQDTGTGDAALEINNNAGLVRFYSAIAGKDVMAFDTSGNVGIGTTSPSQKLEVNGNITIANGTLFQPVYPSDDNLSLYLPFSEGTGTTAYDRSPYGNDGTLTNSPTWNLSGKAGTALSFGGINSEVVMGDVLDMGTADMSIEVWLKMNSQQKAAAIGIVSKYNTHPLYFVALTSGGNLRTRISNTSGVGDYDTTDSSKDLRDGQWHHLAVVFDRDGNMTKYIDGAAVQATDISAINGFDHVNPSNVLRIGNLEASYAYPFNGTMDEVRIYRRALSPDEIRAQYLGGVQSHGSVVADKFRIVNTTGNANFYMAPNGSVGIGTTSPAYKFEVVGAAVAASLNPQTGIFRISSGPTAITGLSIGIAPTDPYGTWIQSTNQPAVSGGTYPLLLNPLGGNVGIGTTAPQTKLEILTDDAVTNAVTNVLMLSHTTTGLAADGIGSSMVFKIEDTNSPDDWAASIEGILTKVSNGEEQGALIFKTLDVKSGRSVNPSTPVEAMRIDTSGNVGIGTASPSTTLQVKGNTSFDVFSQTVGASATLSANATIVKVGGTTDVTLNTSQALSNGLVEGQILIVRHDNNTYGVIIADNATTRLNGDWNSGRGLATLMLTWDGTQWIEISRYIRAP